ncbi:MAG TPA: hypothetical protein VHH72_03950 [Solirubrobacterales bacterium]|jgi:hypothetical protein|nr:hypothetical protein [Solirubrobacterales bacterium]
MRRTLTALACFVALAAAAGCGESDQEQAREVAQDYVEASNAGDFEAVCNLFSDEFINELAVTDCPGFVRENTGGGRGELELVDVRVNDDTATADIDVVSEEGGPIRVGVGMERNADEEWEIVSLQ